MMYRHPSLSVPVLAISFCFVMLIGCDPEPPIINGLEQEADRRNVLFIAVDDFNDWNTVLGGHPQAKTPNLDRLAARGVVFTAAHCAAPACAPSRAAIMTGIRPSTSGNYFNAHTLTGNPVLNGAAHLPEYLNAVGYHVVGAGKLYHGTHFVNELKGRGFDEYYPSKEKDLPDDGPLAGPRPLNGISLEGWEPHWDWGPYAPGTSYEETQDGKTVTWCANRLREATLEAPFFLGVGIFRPHLPFYAPQEYFDRYPLDEIQLPLLLEGDLEDIPPAGRRIGLVNRHDVIVQHGQWKTAIQAYLASIAFVDDSLGCLMDALESSPYASNTVIVLWSDHGYQLGEKERWAKFTLWNRATRVNLVFAGPGVVVGKRDPSPASLLDIYPTLLDLIGLEPPADQLDGRSLAPLLASVERVREDPVVTTYGFATHAVSGSRYRLIQYADGSREFYDLAADLMEWHNLIERPEHARRIADLAAHLPTADARPVP